DLDAPANNPEYADQWGDDREIRAALLRWLCVDPTARVQVDPRGIWIAAARLDDRDRLALSFATLSFPLRIVACWLPRGIALDGTELPELSLARSWIGPLASAAAAEARPAAVIAHGLEVRGQIDLVGAHAEGEVGLYGAEIAGSLACD